MTSLPIGYCYGLSVLHSHLARGASVVLSDRSVVDEAFWRTFRRHGATSFAGVPHTFDLLDRIGFADLRLPSLRYVTQAGGRLAPATVRRYAELGRRRGWELFVMYGQTEATARIAYLPPALVSEHPGAIGIPVPGGHLRLADVDGDGIGELVYRGPNVMLGYAHGPSDLALGRTVDELRTGDLARHDAQGGVFEVVGRRHRFVKPFGLRVDLDRVEEHLRAAGVVAACAGDDHRLVVATSPDDAIAAAALVRDHVGLPAGAVHAHGVDALPRLPNGKLDHGAVLALGAAPVRPARATGVRRLFADALQVPVVGDDATFASLGGDSLSYVELSVRLEEALGDLPDDWPTRTVADLERRREAAPAAGRTVAVETTVVLRAAAIVLVVATHATLVDVKGGAHLLLAVAGWNFARFQLPVGGRRLAGSIGRIALPTMAWVAGLLVVSDDYGLANLALVHTQVHEAVWDPRWRFWFVEALVQILVVCGVVVGVPPLRRLERRAPFGFAVALLGASLALRVLTDVGDAVRRPQAVAWFFFLGWAMHRSRTPGQKLALSAVAVAAVPRFFGQPLRELVIIAGLLALLWVRGVPLVRPLPRVAGAVASASLVVYLTHWQVYPPLLEVASPAVAVAASLGVGLALHAAFQRVLPRLRL